MKSIIARFSSLKEGLRHFIAPALFTLVIFTGIIFEIFSDHQVERAWTFSLMMAGALGFAISFYFASYCRAHKSSARMLLVLNSIAAALSIASYFVADHTQDYSVLAFVGLSITFVVLGVYQFFAEQNKKLFFSQLLVALITASAMAFVFTAGILITIAAVHYLLFEISKYNELVSSIASFGGSVFWPVSLLALLPQHESTKVSPKALKILVYQVAFPTFVALIAVLYVYIAKILITWNLPSGQINWFVSYASLAFIIFALTLPQYESRAISLFKRFGGFVMIPLIIVQLIMIYIRVSAYGLTPARWASLVCIAIAIAFVIASLFKSMKNVHYAVLAIVAGAIILSVGPLNLFEVPAWEQSVRLTKILESNGLLAQGELSARASLEKAEQERVFSAFLELDRYRERGGVIHTPEWLPERSGFETAFGFKLNENYYWENLNNDDEPYYVYHNWNSLDLATASYLYFVGNGAENTSVVLGEYGVITIDGERFDITEALAKLPRNETTNDADYRIVLSSKYVLSIESVTIYPNPDSSSYNDLAGFIIVKE